MKSNIGKQVIVTNRGKIYSTHSEHIKLGATKFAYGETPSEDAIAEIIGFHAKDSIINADVYIISITKHYIIGCDGVSDPSKLDLQDSDK